MDIFDAFLSSSNAISNAYGIHGDDDLLNPPSPDYGYDSTPLNSLTFASMGCDGVHYALITINGKKKEECPVAMICPMDSDDICFLANSFKEYISQGCGIDVDKLNSLVEEESSMPGSFAQFVKEHFQPRYLSMMTESNPLIWS